MRIFLAGTSVSNPENESKMQSLFKKGHKLHSYYHAINGFETKWFNTNMKNKVDLFIDSGAFSAWTQKTEVDIQKYIKFIQDNTDVISVYANLDVIGLGGKMPNALTAKKTLENQRIMESAGLSPIPVFHYGEPFKYLEYYVNNYEYLALGVAGNSGTTIVPWLNKCFSQYICDSKGFPKLKIHGFAVTSFDLMFRFPWYSVDSTSWVITGRLGSIFVPVYRSGQFDYSQFPHKIAVSSVSPNIKEAGKHISNLSPKQKTILLEYLKLTGYSLGESKFQLHQQTYELCENEKWSGKKPKDKNEKRLVETIVEAGVSNTYQLRDELNIKYYLELEKHMPKYPWAFKDKQNQKLLFS